jgi:serine/threonine-protein kinase
MWSPSSEEWQEIEPQIDAILALPPDQRSAAAAKAFASRPELLAWIARLITGAEDDAWLADVDPSLVAGAFKTAARDAATAGRRFGPFVVQREIGRGGMGTVYLAERSDGQFQQRVAIKLIARGFSSDDTRRRFASERQILARLEHPNVARLVDGGVTADDQPWFAMEYIEGEPLDDYCDRRRLDVASRLTLFLSVCDAVQAAHQRLVIHRDLKPSNIFVTADGSVKLLDFGIAKLTGAGEGNVDVTQTGQRSFTPEYASPEQWRGEPVTTASDCYSLGVVLYQLLCGARPHSLRDRPELEWPRIVLQEPIAAPSAVVSEAAAERQGTSRDRVRRQLRGDLDTIALTALRVEVERRYPTVRQFADDIRRYLDALPISARPDTWRYRTGKFVRRNRVGVASVALILVSLVAGGVGVLWQARRAEQAASEATAVSSFLTGMFQTASPLQARGDSLTAGEMLQRAAASIDSAFAGRPDLQVRLLNTIAEINRDLGALGRADTLSRRAVQLADSAKGRAQSSSAMALGILADITRARGDYRLADSLMVEAIQRVRQYDNPDTTLARLLDGRGHILYRLQKLAAAESAYREAITHERGLDELFRGSLRSNLSITLNDAGRDAEADSVSAQSIAIYRAAGLSDHPDFVVALSNRAALLDGQWKVDSALALKRDVRERLERVYPQGHDRVLIAINNYASTLLQLSEHAEAERGFRDAHAMSLRLHGSSNFFSLVTLFNVGRAQFAAKSPAQAETTFRSVLKTARASLGDQHSFISHSWFYLARSLAAQGRSREALALLDSSLALAQKALPPSHRLRADVRYVQGSIYLADGRLGAADSASREAMTWRRANLNEKDPDVAHAIVLLARTLKKKDGAARRAEIDALYAEAIERLERTNFEAATVAELKREVAALW